jgi:hypothetical protein
MATSTIVAFKRALHAALVARVGLAGVLVTRGVEPVDQMVTELVVIGDVTRSSQTAAALGRQRREEDYSLDVEVSVLGHHADDPDALAERAAALVAEVEAELRSNIDVGGVVRTAQVASVGLQEGSDGNQRWAVMPMSVTVRQRI